MKCEKSVEITAYLKGETPEGEREALRSHFERCPTCSVELSKFDKVLSALGKMEGVDPSPGFKWRVREAFLRAHPEFLEAPKRETLSFWQSLRQQFSYVPAWAISMAAHVILLAVAAILLFTPKSPEDLEHEVAMQARPRKAPGDAPRFDPSGRPLPPDRVGHFAPEGPGPEEYTPSRRPSDPALRLPPHPLRNPNEHKIDASKWRERIQKDRRLLAFFEGRGSESQQRAMREAFGSQGSEKAVRAALEWLARRQQSDGRWTGPELRSEQGGTFTYSVGLTGLCLLSFLAEGHAGKGEFGPVVRKGLEFLLSEQKVSGLVGSDHGNYMYNHAIAALALLEASLMTRDDALDTAAAAAINFTVAAQNESGGWGYAARSLESDTSVAGWQILLLRLAKLGGNQGVITSLVQANHRLQLMTDSEGKVGYRGRMQFPNGYLALTAVGMCSHQMSTHTPDPELLAKQAGVLLERSPILGTAPADYPMNDLYFAYFGTLAMHQYGGDAWAKWYSPLREKLLKTQASDGSWPESFDRWWLHGGQVYTTAISALTLQTPSRYPRLSE
jgi:hypothetical protein